MKKRTALYLRQSKARKVIANAIEKDLKTFLNAAFELSHNGIVRRHIKNTLMELEGGTYQLSA
jgi:hypothetical protein